MSDQLIQSLLQQSNAREVAPEELEAFGKEAASKYLNGSCSTLNEAVEETIKHAQLSPEQVKRVVEFTNTDAYLKKVARSGDQHKVISFPEGPADYSEIFKGLNDGGGGTVFDPGTGDYDEPPAQEKTASAREEMALFAAFQTSHQPEYPYANPHAPIEEVRDKLASAKDLLEAQYNTLEVMYDDLSVRLYDKVKAASLGGSSLRDVMEVWHQANPSPEFAKLAFEQFLTQRLLEDEVFPSVDAIGESLEKKASGNLPNAEHPLAKDYGSFCEVVEKMGELRGAIEELSTAYDQTSFYFQKQASVGKAYKALKGGLKGAGEALGGTTDEILQAVGASKGVSNAAGKTVGFGIRNAPEIGATYLGARAAEKTDAGQQLKFRLKSKIPGTREWSYARQMRGVR